MSAQVEGFAGLRQMPERIERKPGDCVEIASDRADAEPGGELIHWHCPVDEPGAVAPEVYGRAGFFPLFRPPRQTLGRARADVFFKIALKRRVF